MIIRCKVFAIERVSANSSNGVGETLNVRLSAAAGFRTNFLTFYGLTPEEAEPFALGREFDLRLAADEIVES